MHLLLLPLTAHTGDDHRCGQPEAGTVTPPGVPSHAPGCQAPGHSELALWCPSPHDRHDDPIDPPNLAREGVTALVRDLTGPVDALTTAELGGPR